MWCIASYKGTERDVTEGKECVLSQLSLNLHSYSQSTHTRVNHAVP